MATTTKQNNTAPLGDAFERVTELNEQFLDAARKAGVQYLDSYEKAVDRTIEFERKVAGATQQEWLKGLIDAQIDLTHEFAGAYTKAARGLLK